MRKYASAMTALVAVALLTTSACASDSGGGSDTTSAQGGGQTTGATETSSTLTQTGLSTTGSGNSDGGSGTAGAPPTGPGFDGKEIHIGLLGAISGPFASAGKAQQAGKQAAIDDLNASGGIAGKYKLVGDLQDAAYDATVGVQKYDQLYSRVVMFDILGTPVVNAVKSKLQQNNMIAAVQSFTTDVVQDPNLLPSAVPGQTLADNGIAYDWENGGSGKTYCAVALDNDSGVAALQGYDFITKALGAKVGPSVKVAATDTDLTGATNTFKSAGCDRIFVWTTATQTASLVTTANQANYSPFYVLAVPAFDPSLMAGPAAQTLAKNSILTSPFPAWGDTSVPGMAKMVAAAQKYQPDYAKSPNIQFLFGYQQMLVAIAVLNKAVELGDVSPAGVLKAAAETGEVDLAGIAPEYNYLDPAKRTPPTDNAILRPDASTPGGLKSLQNGFTSKNPYKY